MTRRNVIGVNLGRLGFWVALCVACLSGAVEVFANPPVRHKPMGVANGCFVESIALGDELRAQRGEGAWYRLLQWGAKEADEVVAGHAVLIFEHAGGLWCYDINVGFKKLDAPAEQRDDVEAVAKEVTAPYVNKITPRYPIYREDFPQPPEPRAPEEAGMVEEPEVRDAALVAVRLAKARPVSLVEFAYPKDGDTRKGAVAVFVFGGRLCVYSANHGTVPFRARALSTKNLRQLQELLRRMYPGATNLKAR